MKRSIITILLLLSSLPQLLRADDSRNFDYSSFARIPILQDGRIKPLDSFARVMLKRISGQSSLENTPAIEWLARALFTPSDAMNAPLFLIESNELLRTLSVTVRDDHRYSFSELASAFAAHSSLLEALGNKDKKSLTAPEQELVSLYTNVNDFADITSSFSLLMPLEVDKETQRILKINASSVTYLSLLKNRKDIETKTTDILSRKKDRSSTYSPDELRLAKLSTHLTLMEAMDRNNTLLRIIPPFWEGSEEWLSPWAVIEKGMGSPQSAALFADWQALAAAYQQQDATTWHHQSENLLQQGVNGRGVRVWALELEILYNHGNLLSLALAAYALGFLLAITLLLRHSKHWQNCAYGVLFAGALLHAAAIAMRMAILMRPPVSTLYESMIFVSFIAICFGLWLERNKKEADGLLISSAIACLLLTAANVFAGSNDTLEVLVAVLNTNFWLATHVVCITTGYGSSLVAGMLAHLYLFKRAVGKAQGNDLTTLQRRIHSVALVALLFTATGTMLGGIWADQSWGRFWGWDPKENGALWIVLWLIWVLHGRLAGQMGHLGFAVSTALINIVVALAWVGVNLLSVGLHSYGFTDAAATGLLSFCAFELGFIGITSVIILQRGRYIHYS